MFSATAPGDLDGSGTINPASLGPSSVYSPHLSTTQHHPFSPPATATSEYAPDIKSTVVGTVSPRGIKRSHSPDHNNSHSYNKDGSVGDAGALSFRSFFIRIPPPPPSLIYIYSGQSLELSLLLPGPQSITACSSTLCQFYLDTPIPSNQPAATQHHTIIMLPCDTHAAAATTACPW